MKKICLVIVVIVLLLAGSLPNTISTASAASTIYTSNEAYSRILKLKEQGKIPAYVLEKGKYKYIEGTRAARVKGANVNMRSQPKIDSRRITRFNVNTELEYLGEWTHPKNGERWVCVRKNSSSEVGWILGKYIQLIPNSVNSQNTRSQVKGKTSNSTKNNDASNAVKPEPIGNSLKVISIENNLNRTLKKYAIIGIVIWIITFIGTFLFLGWEFNTTNILAFIFHSIAAIMALLVLYFILYIVWKGIILPILKVFMLIAGIFLVLVFMTKDGWILPYIIMNEMNNKRED